MSILALNTGIIDIWTLVHLGSAFSAVVLGSRFLKPGQILVIVILVATAWELFEISQHPDGFGGSESAINFLADMAAAAIGAAIGLAVVTND